MIVDKHKVGDDLVREGSINFKILDGIRWSIMKRSVDAIFWEFLSFNVQSPIAGQIVNRLHCFAPPGCFRSGVAALDFD